LFPAKKITCSLKEREGKKDFPLPVAYVRKERQEEEKKEYEHSALNLRRKRKKEGGVNYRYRSRGGERKVSSPSLFSLKSWPEEAEDGKKEKRDRNAEPGTTASSNQKKEKRKGGALLNSNRSKKNQISLGKGGKWGRKKKTKAVPARTFKADSTMRKKEMKTFRVLLR